MDEVPFLAHIDYALFWADRERIKALGDLFVQYDWVMVCNRSASRKHHLAT